VKSGAVSASLTVQAGGVYIQVLFKIVPPVVILMIVLQQVYRLVS